MAKTESPLTPAFESLRNGDFESAESVCRDVIRDDATNAKAWHLLGIVNAQRNELRAAVECFEKATQYDGNAANYHYNLALACKGLDDLDGAINAYRSAVELKPEFLEAQINLGNCLIECDDEFKQAIEHFRRLSELFPEESVVHFNLGNVLQDAGHFNESINAFRKAVEVDPDCASARENLGRALSDVTRYDDAMEVWQDWLRHEPDNPVARHMVAAITGEDAPERCEDQYVRETFDENFAKSYESQLERIGYRVPALIAEAVDSLRPTRQDLEVLDAGCGTGLCADSLKPLSRRLIGIDLSADMLGEASTRAVYDELHEVELTAFLDRHPDVYDLIVSGDTLCYFGRLEEVFGGAARCLKPDGIFVFTVETYGDPEEDESDESDAELTQEQDADSGDVPPKEFELQPHGRYRHGRSYLEAALADAGLSLLRVNERTLRMERGRKVPGLVVTAQLDAS